ncbi:MAG: DUF998 domain-containing protein [Microlunatus sp.]|nr:DUF998 domain-containing protein [Microlunatus sp.]
MSATVLDRRTPPVVRPDSSPVRSGSCVRLVTLLAAAALVPMIIAHVIGAAVVDPWTDPISWYAFVPGGAAMIIAGGSLLAVLGVLITIRMYRGRLADGPLPAIAMAVFCVAMIMVGAVPTDPPHTAPTISATIHRISAGTAFAILPPVGLMISRAIPRPRTAFPRRLRRAGYLLATLVGVFLSIHLPLAFAGSGIAAFGFLERAGFVIMIGYLFLLGATVDRESWAARN